MQESDKNDGITFYDQPNPIMPKSHAIVATFCPELLKIPDFENTGSGLNLFNRFLNTFEE